MEEEKVWRTFSFKMDSMTEKETWLGLILLGRFSIDSLRLDYCYQPLIQDLIKIENFLWQRLGWGQWRQFNVEHSLRLEKVTKMRPRSFRSLTTSSSVVEKSCFSKRKAGVSLTLISKSNPNYDIELCLTPPALKLKIDLCNDIAFEGSEKLLCSSRTHSRSPHIYTFSSKLFFFLASSSLPLWFRQEFLPK